uniref:Secreted protein n=1 Tax=Vespula pensylvanica TaxID=30213 RepID=A0A834JM51_VESPE|nr:hypothetical protein H0235_017652 [Vespula pensylvanica]
MVLLRVSWQSAATVTVTATATTAAAAASSKTVNESVGERGNVGRLLCNTRQRRQATQEGATIEYRREGMYRLSQVLIFYEPVCCWVNVCKSKAMQDDAIEMAN